MIVINEKKLSKNQLKELAYQHGYSDIDFFIEKHHLGLDTIITALNDLNGLIKEPFEKMER